MRVLGIAGGFGHDSAAALVVDGEVIAACEEERFTRQKRAMGQPAAHSLQACLDAAGMGLSDVDCIALGWNPALAPQDARLITSLETFLATHRMANEPRLPEIVPVEHHVAHAALAFHTSGFDRAAVLIVDGQGEAVSTTIYRAGPNGMDEVRRFAVRDSLGFFYAAVSRFIGFSPGSAGKTMGLAALGEVTYDFPEIVLTADGYVVDMRGDQKAERMDRWLERMADVFGPHAAPAFRTDPATGRLRSTTGISHASRNAAASAQAALERVLLHLARLALAYTGHDNLVLGGGVALNCAANGRLRAALPAVGLFVHGAAHDGGTALGAALAVAADCVRGPLHARRSMFLGPQFNAGSAVDLARRTGITVTSAEDRALARTCELIHEGKVGGWFHGRPEYGPRALGARSIVARADDCQVAAHVNRIKGREHWRPLGPAVTAALATDLRLEGPGLDSMVEARFAKPLPAAAEIAGVIHVDGSIRPLVVPSEHPFAELFSALRESVGLRAVINTSLNLSDEPMVLSPVDALRTFVSSRLDFLVLDGALLEKGS